MNQDATIEKLIFDITKKGNKYTLNFKSFTDEEGAKIKIEAAPLYTGLGCTLTIREGANLCDALKAIEYRLH